MTTPPPRPPARLRARARRRAGLLLPECHQAYEALGFYPSAREIDGVAMPDGPAYFTSRGSVMGQVPGDVVAAAFGVFNPEVVVPASTSGGRKTDAATICEARTDGAVGQLRRILGDEPEGVDRANELLARAVEPLRPEGPSCTPGSPRSGYPTTRSACRGGAATCCASTAATATRGVGVGRLDATEIGLLTELYWGFRCAPTATRAWTDEQFDAATERLEPRPDRRRAPSPRPGAAARGHRGAHRRADAPGDRRPRRRRRRALRPARPWGEAIRAAGGYRRPARTTWPAPRAPDRWES